VKTPSAAAVLRENVQGLQQAIISLERATEGCAGMGDGPSFTFAELDAIEILASRFSRTTDFLVNKVMRAIDRYELEPEGSLIDVINRAEKRGLVESARVLREMKELRNEIVHEYLPAGLAELRADLRRLTPQLIAIAQRTVAHAERLGR
jgi:hypothetical protein